jgi:hypothetical protein
MPMRYTWALVILLILAPLSAQTGGKKKPAKKSKQAVATQSITGCVDEKSAEFVLRTDDNLKELAKLEPVGFDKTNFARFVGHKVTVTGEMLYPDGVPTVRVTSLDHIKNISDVCAPAGEAPPVTK